MYFHNRRICFLHRMPLSGKRASVMEVLSRIFVVHRGGIWCGGNLLFCTGKGMRSTTSIGLLRFSLCVNACVFFFSKQFLYLFIFIILLFYFNICAIKVYLNFFIYFKSFLFIFIFTFNSFIVGFYKLTEARFFFK